MDTPVPVDQAGGVALGRHAQRHDRALAERLRGEGGDASQFHHVIDVAPTVLDVAGLPAPTFVNGIQQEPMQGVSMEYSFDDAAAPGIHRRQYFEMFCNRGIYHQGWTAVTRHSTPWVRVPRCPRSTTTYGSCMPDTDWSQAHDLANEQPDRLRSLQRLFLIEAVKYNVLPLDDRRIERINSELAGRPQLVPVPRSCSSAAWAGSPRARSSTSRTSRTRSPRSSTSRTAVRAA